MNNLVNEMRVIKRDGTLQEVSFDKISERVKKLGREANIHINYSALIIKVIEQLHDNIPTGKIDELTAEQCASMSTIHTDYSTLASRVVVSNHHKNTDTKFSKIANQLYGFTNSKGENTPLVSDTFIDFVNHYSEQLDGMVDFNRDYLIDYFGFKTLEKAYLIKINNKIVERPQHMWLRVAVGIHGDLNRIHTDLKYKEEDECLRLVKETYDLMSQKYFTHATPTLFNAGTTNPQLSSCYLVAMEEDSIEGIYNTLKDCAQISKYSGGIGLHIHNIRPKGSYIKGTNGKTDGIVPMLRVFNSTARYVNQSGKRNGSIAVYLEPWHADIEDFLELKKNHGDEELKARDLFYAMWISDLFMERVKGNAKWSLFCNNACPGLIETYGDEFAELYEKYETDGKAVKTINARDLWFKILDAQMETGTPYILYKDAANKKSNQKNLGTIKSSNLCTEIMEYSDAEETAVCNLASIALPAFVNAETKLFDYESLHEVAKIVANNLNRVIDINFYPTEKTKKSNFRHRPIGIGVQGLADTFFMMDVSFHSEQAKIINKHIFETIYHATLERSNEIAIERENTIRKMCDENGDLGILQTTKFLTRKNPYDFNYVWNAVYTKRTPVLTGTYSTFEGSPASKGLLQFDLWGVEPSERYDWVKLKQSVVRHGLRNSLLVAPMPTASTSQILGYTECFEPITSNLYTRRTQAGEFVVVNKYLMKELYELGMWNEKIKNNIISNKGSVQQLTALSEHIRNKYKIVWEMPMKHLIDMSADRGAFICQSQSLNLWIEDPTYNSLTSMHFYSWKKGLKTGIYYLRRKAKHQAQQFTIEPEQSTDDDTEKKDEICEMCSA